MKKVLLDVLSLPIAILFVIVFCLGTVLMYLGVALVCFSRIVAWPFAALGVLLQFLGAHLLPNRGM